MLVSLLAYLAGCWWAREVLPLAGEAATGAASAAVVALAAWLARRSRSAFPLVLAGLALFGGLAVQRLAEQRAHALHMVDRMDPGLHYPARARVAAPTDELDSGAQFVELDHVDILSGPAAGRVPGRVRLLVEKRAARGTRLFFPGERVVLSAKFAPPAGFRNFFGPESARNLANRGIWVTARTDSPILPDETAGESGLLPRVHRTMGELRRACGDILLAHMNERPANLTASMVFNDRTLMGDADARAFRDSNTIHLFAVSGMHVAMFALILGLLMGAAGIRRRAAALVLLGVLSAYMLMIGLSPAPVRAYLIALAVTLGWWLRREVDNWSALTFALAVIVLHNPLAMWQPGLQLSLAGVAGILFLERPLREGLAGPDGDGGSGLPWWKRGARTLWAASTVTLAATLMVLPLQMHYFAQVNLLSPVANMVACPVSGVVLGGALATVAAGAVSATLGDLLGAATSCGMEFLTGLAHAVAGCQWAILTPGSLPSWGVLAYYVILGSGYYIVVRDTPEWLPKSRARLAVHGALALLLLMIAVGIRLPGRTLRIWFLDVGQGDATLVEFPDGRTMLVDAGRPSPNVAKLVIQPHLMAVGAVPLGTLLATHADSDHTGGMPWLLSHHRVGALAFAGDGGLLGESWLMAGMAGMETRELVAGTVVDCGSGATLEVLWPPAHSDALSDNERSVVIRVSYGGFRALLTGDAGVLAESALSPEACRADVLKVSHHGSRSSTSAEFLSKVAASVAVISCGEQQSYGHPHKETLERLQAAGALVYRTDRDGAVCVEATRDSYSVRSVVGSKRAGF